MKTSIVFSTIVCVFFFLTGCKKCDTTYTPVADKITLSQNYVPYKTEKYLRICYMLNTWEFEKEGLKLQQVVVFDNDTKADLFTIEKADLPFIWKGPLQQSPEFKIDQIYRYYISFQIPILLNQTVPDNISHRFILTDTISNQRVTVEGGIVHVRKNEAPRLIASPVTGNLYLFHNQSTMGYHYYLAFFINRGIWTNEKFAFDLTQINEDWQDTYSGDPKKNESFFAYGDTLYAVGTGTVVKVVDGRAENSGNARDAVLTINDTYYGNYLVLDIGGCWAVYMHCLPGSFRVKAGDHVEEGQPVARLGNSGNSTEPHLHFQLNDVPDPAFSHGLPLMFKKYTKIGEIRFGTPPGPVQLPPVEATNANMENWSIVRIE